MSKILVKRLRACIAFLWSSMEHDYSLRLCPCLPLWRWCSILRLASQWAQKCERRETGCGCPQSSSFPSCWNREDSDSKFPFTSHLHEVLSISMSILFSVIHSFAYSYYIDSICSTGIVIISITSLFITYSHIYMLWKSLFEICHFGLPG